jgi:hypothetical protein
MSLRHALRQPNHTPSVSGLSLLGPAAHPRVGVTPQEEALITAAAAGQAAPRRLLIDKMERMETKIDVLTRKVDECCEQGGLRKKGRTSDAPSRYDGQLMGDSDDDHPGPSSGRRTPPPVYR